MVCVYVCKWIIINREKIEGKYYLLWIMDRFKEVINVELFKVNVLGDD